MAGFEKMGSSRAMLEMTKRKSRGKMKSLLQAKKYIRRKATKRFKDAKVGDIGKYSEMPLFKYLKSKRTHE